MIGGPRRGFATEVPRRARWQTQDVHGAARTSCRSLSGISCESARAHGAWEGRPLAAGGRVIARGACMALICVLAVPAWAVAQARTDSDPTRPILFSIRPEFYR